MKVLIINYGSSSLKFQLLEPDTAPAAKGQVGDVSGKVRVEVCVHNAKIVAGSDLPVGNAVIEEYYYSLPRDGFITPFRRRKSLLRKDQKWL